MMNTLQETHTCLNHLNKSQNIDFHLTRHRAKDSGTLDVYFLIHHTVQVGIMIPCDQSLISNVF